MVVKLLDIVHKTIYDLTPASLFSLESISSINSKFLSQTVFEPVSVLSHWCLTYILLARHTFSSPLTLYFLNLIWTSLTLEYLSDPLPTLNLGQVLSMGFFFFFFKEP